MLAMMNYIGLNAFQPSSQMFHLPSIKCSNLVTVKEELFLSVVAHRILFSRCHIVDIYNHCCNGI